MQFLQPQTVAAMGAEWFMYTQVFRIAGAAGGSPGTRGSGTIGIQSSGPFWSEGVLISYPTVNGGADDGVPRLEVQIRNSSNNIPLTSDYVPVELIAVPGRRPTSGITSATPQESLHLPSFPMQALFPTSGSIGLDFRNYADTEAEVHVAFTGYLLNKEIVPDSSTFWRILRENQVSAPWVDGG